MARWLAEPAQRIAPARRYQTTSQIIYEPGISLFLPLYTSFTGSGFRMRWRECGSAASE